MESTATSINRDSFVRMIERYNAGDLDGYLGPTRRLGSRAHLSIVARKPARPRQMQRRLMLHQVDQLVAEYLAGDDMTVLAARWGLH